MQSLNAPGLPYPPRISGFRSSNNTKHTKIVPVLSINYDYLPMSLESPKNLWVDLKYSPPSDLMVNSPVVLHITPNRGIRTSMNPLTSQSVFEVSDIIGSRLVLSPYRGDVWLPTYHAASDSPFGWGYNMNMTNVSASMHDVKYGYGAPVSYIEYVPQSYSVHPGNFNTTWP